MSALHCDCCTFSAVHCWKAWFQRTCMSIKFSIVCRLENVEFGKRKCCLRKSPGKASNFPSKTLFEPCSSCGYYFCFSWGFRITFTANGKRQMEVDNYEKNPIQNPSYFLTDEPQRHKTSNIRELQI